jgi:hypothetical protein
MAIKQTKKIATLAKDYDVPSELLLRLLQEHGVEVRSHLSSIEAGDFLAIKEELLKEKEKLSSRKKGKGVVKKSAGKSGEKNDASGSGKKPTKKVLSMGAKVTLKRAKVTKKAELEKNEPENVAGQKSAAPKTDSLKASSPKAELSKSVGSEDSSKDALKATSSQKTVAEKTLGEKTLAPSTEAVELEKEKNNAPALVGTNEKPYHHQTKYSIQPAPNAVENFLTQPLPP